MHIKVDNMQMCCTVHPNELMGQWWHDHTPSMCALSVQHPLFAHSGISDNAQGYHHFSQVAWICSFSVNAATFSTSLTLPTRFQLITYTCFCPDPISATGVSKQNYMYTRLARLFTCMQFDQKTRQCNTVHMHDKGNTKQPVMTT